MPPPSVAGAFHESPTFFVVAFHVGLRAKGQLGADAEYNHEPLDSLATTASPTARADLSHFVDVALT